LADEVYLAVGSLNRDAPYFQGARGEGLGIYVFDPKRLATRKLASTNTVDNPTFLSVDSRRGAIYANSEVFGWHEGTVSAYRFDPGAGRLDYINKQPTLGSIAAHNTASRDGRFLLVANYAMGSGGPDKSLAVFPIGPDGAIGQSVASVAHSGAVGHDPDRQERSHAHCIVETVVPGTFLCADLGLDAVIGYALDASGGLQRLSQTDMPAGSGPRHIAIHPGGQLVFVSNELNSTVSALMHTEQGWVPVDTHFTVPPGVTDSHVADIQVSPNGRFVYISNRGHDSIARFAVDAQSGRLDPLGHTPSGGATPRNFALTPDGGHLLVANQNGDAIVVFACDNNNGALVDTGSRIDIGTPVCVRPFVL
jgi:6-phosphogluconolactonase